MWVSINNKIYTSMAGTAEANMIQNGTPSKGINHPRFSGSDGEKPSGTFNFSV